MHNVAIPQLNGARKKWKIEKLKIKKIKKATKLQSYNGQSSGRDGKKIPAGNWSLVKQEKKKSKMQKKTTFFHDKLTKRKNLYFFAYWIFTFV